MKDSKIQLLDCTLRDGGYLNNWEFGETNLKDTIQLLTDAGVQIIEIGFLRDESHISGRAVWDNVIEASEYLPKNKNNCKYALMAEIFNPIPLEKIPPRDENTIDIIRVIVWRKKIKEGLKYCKQLKELGYEVCIQPDRVDQYSYEDFAEVVRQFASIEPYAIYVVDSNGFLSRNEIIQYLKTADDNVPDTTCIGYHGHNNLLQALGAAEDAINTKFKHTLIIDGSVNGIGRSSGNLNTELIAYYLNKEKSYDYKLINFFKIYDNCIESIKETAIWGYTMETCITSIIRCNPNYARILKDVFKMKTSDICEIVQLLSKEDRVIFNKDAVAGYIDRYSKMNN